MLNKPNKSPFTYETINYVLSHLVEGRSINMTQNYPEFVFSDVI